MEEENTPIVHTRIPEPFMQATDPDEIDRILADQDRYDAALAAINEAEVRRARGEEPAGTEEPPENAEKPSQGAEKPEGDKIPPEGEKPPEEPPARGEQASEELTRQEIELLRKYGVKVDEDSGLIEGRYKTVDAYFKGVQEMKSLVGRKLTAEFIEQDPDRARAVLESLGIRTQPPAQPTVTEKPQQTPGTEFEKIPQQPDVVDRWLDQQIPVRPILEQRFTEDLKAAEIPFPETKEDWAALGDSFPRLYTDMMMAYRELDTQRRYLRDRAQQALEVRRQVIERTPEYERQLVEQDLSKLKEDFGELPDDVVRQRIAELVLLKNDPRAARYYDDSGAGTSVLSENAVYHYLLQTERDALFAARDKRIKEAALEERKTFYDDKAKSTPKAFATAIGVAGKGKDRSGASTPIPSPAQWKNRAYTDQFSTEELEAMAEQIQKLPNYDEYL